MQRSPQSDFRPLGDARELDALVLYASANELLRAWLGVAMLTATLLFGVGLACWAYGYFNPGDGASVWPVAMLTPMFFLLLSCSIQEQLESGSPAPWARTLHDHLYGPLATRLQILAIERAREQSGFRNR